MFHYALLKYLSDEIVRVQKQALQIVYPFVHYNDTSIKSVLETLHARRHAVCAKLFNQILDDPNHKLNELVSRPNSPLIHDLRKEKNFFTPEFSTDRFKTSFNVSIVLLMHDAYQSICPSIHPSNYAYSQIIKS